MTTLAKNVYHLRSNEAAAADDHDSHNFIFRFRCFVFHNDCIVVALWLSAKRLSVANEEVDSACSRLLFLLLLDFPLDPRVGNQPEKRGEHVQSGGNPWTNKREWDSGEIKHKREFTLPLASNGLRHKGVATFLGDDDALENIISNGCHQ